MRVLAVDCADKAVSCAVVEDNRIIAESFSSVGFTHSKTLMPLIRSTLEINEIETGSIDKIAVTCGPGSFTGLRIGIATVKGLAFKENIPCVAVSTLHAIAMGAVEQKGIICAVMDARCNQVYNALFESDGKKLTRLTEDRALMCDALKAELDKFDKEIFVVGGGADMFCKKYEWIYNLPTPKNRYQRASDVALICNEYDEVSGAALQPSYLRLPQAERELKERTENV